MELIVASEKELTWVPELKWAPKLRAICVSEVRRENHPAIAAVFSKQHIYAIGAMPVGCACGFYGENEDARRAREDLSAFLERALDAVPELELFAHYCEPATVAVLPSSIDTIGPNDIRDWRWDFKCDEFLLVVKDD
jgi:hypothetical protein